MLSARGAGGPGYSPQSLPRTPPDAIGCDRNEASLKAVSRVRSAAEESFKRILEVKKLIPMWQVYVKKEASLRYEENRLKRELNSVSTKARRLHRRIDQLSSQ